MSQFGTGHMGSFSDQWQLQEQYQRSQRMPERQSRTFADVGEWHEPNAGAGGKNVGETERILSVAAGAGLATLGLMRGRMSGLVLSGLGAALVWRGYSGRCQCYAALGLNTARHNDAVGVPAQQGVKIEKSLHIHRSPEELYRFWRRLENLPRIMSHVERVDSTDSQRSHWVAKGPLGTPVEWDAEIINERENELLAWRSIPGGTIDTAGSVHFNRAADGSTEMVVSMKYNPPAGKVGDMIADWMGDGLEQKLDEDLCRFKSAMESGAMHESPVGQQTSPVGQL
jgi:uncharacterized membrane protein